MNRTVRVIGWVMWLTWSAVAFGMGCASFLDTSFPPRLPEPTCFLLPHTQPSTLAQGIVICNPEPASAPTVGEVAHLVRCLQTVGETVDPALLDGWKYYTASDIILYPMLPGILMTGFTDRSTKSIFVRRDFFPPEREWATKMHETMHVLRGRGNHDAAYHLCAGA